MRRGALDGEQRSRLATRNGDLADYRRTIFGGNERESGPVG